MWRRGKFSCAWPFLLCLCSWQIPRSCGLAQLFERSHVTGESLAIRELVGAISAFSVQKIEETGSATLVGVFSDVAGLFGLVDVAAAIELNDFVIRMESGISIDDIGDDLFGGFGGEFFGLRDGVFGAGDFSLIAIE